MLWGATAWAGQVDGSVGVDYFRSSSRREDPREPQVPRGLTAQDIGMRVRARLLELDDRLEVIVDYRGREAFGGQIADGVAANANHRLLYRGEVRYAIIEDRRAKPRDDLASLLANARIDGEPMGMMETLGYFLITFTAGHDTTKNALVGGMQAFLEHPEQFETLRRDRTLLDSAVEEVVRWTTPVNHMKRRVLEDYELRGQKLRAGDWLVMFYASANRDEEIFEAPFEFKIDRNPNRHLGFGIGEHFCLGANLARRSQRALLAELADRMEWAELSGEPERIHSAFVVGLKKLPMRYRIRPAT